VNPEPLNLEPIKARCDVATPGPWTCDSLEGVRCVAIVEHEHPDLNRYVNTQTGVGRSGTLEDGEFIAHTRVDVPALIAEIERLRVETNNLKTSYDHEVVTRVSAELEIERLRDVITELRIARLRERVS